MKKKKTLDPDILLAAQDIAKRARQYLDWHEGKPGARHFSVTQFRSALGDFAGLMELYEQQTEQS